MSEGGIGLLDVSTRNEAIDLMWLKTYLSFGEKRPKWALLADALFAKAAAASAKSVEDSAKINPFLQTWKVSTRETKGLPDDLKRMIKTAKKYALGFAPVLPGHLIITDKAANKTAIPYGLPWLSSPIGRGAPYCQ